MPDPPQSRPRSPPPEPPADPDVYGGQWGAGDPKQRSGSPPSDRPDKIKVPPEKN